MDMDTVIITYFLRRPAQTDHSHSDSESEISTLEMDRTCSIADFLGLALAGKVKDSSKARVWIPRMPITTFPQFTTLVSSLSSPTTSVNFIAHPLNNESTIEEDLPEFHHYVIIDVPPSSTTFPNLPSPPPSPKPQSKAYSLYTPNTPLDTVLSHQLFSTLDDFSASAQVQVPIELTHPAFGHFLDAVDECEVGQEEALFLSQLCGALRKRNLDDSERFSEVPRLLSEWLDLEFRLACRGTDSWVSSSPLSTFILTHSNSHSSNLQHSHLALNALLRTIPLSPTPSSSLHIHLCGPFLTISGITYTSFEVVHAPLWSSGIGHSEGAARGVKALRVFLENVNSTPEGEGRSLKFPYALTHLPSSSSTPSSSSSMPLQIDTRFLTKPFPSRLLFFSESHSSTHNLCIKFTKSYSASTHEFCASRGHAPRLHGVQRLPGGWWMVVMDRVGLEYVPLRYYLESLDEDGEGDGDGEEMKNTVLGFLGTMHEEGYVHGDMRPENIFVKPSSPSSKSELGCMLIDFDWAGREGEAQYPWDVNSLGVSRPESVRGGGFITREEDVAMVWGAFDI